MSGEVDQRPVVDDAAPDFADDDRLHAVEGSHEGYRRSPRYDSAERPHVLVQDNPRPDQPAEAGARQMPA